jgi:hypothetical protein
LELGTGSVECGDEGLLPSLGFVKLDLEELDEVLEALVVFGHSAAWATIPLLFRLSNALALFSEASAMRSAAAASLLMD